ncbi:heme NO-binding domain-containing protein [Phaeovulum sp.]|uniref:heme NO-binding domain-containing protein n=1 Tax=Phaeovulum sp. TaxID=2934796 RepID=UPI0039E26BBF
MHGLINRSIQCFLRETYGTALWADVAATAELGTDGFEAMLHYDDAVTEAVLAAAASRLDKARVALLEDLGSFLVTHEPLRRLLRFGGIDYADFLMSLDELQGRGLLALPDLDLPALTLWVHSGGRFTLTIRGNLKGWGAIATGLLRAVADDYGALATIEPLPDVQGQERLSIELHEGRFAEGRRFELAQPERRAE